MKKKEEEKGEITYLNGVVKKEKKKFNKSKNKM